MHCCIIFNKYHTAEKATIYKCTNFQHHLSLLLSAASTHTIKQYPANNPQLTSQWWHDCGKLFGAEDCSWQCQETIYRQYIRTGKNISFIDISPIYRDWLHSLGTRSAGKSLKFASTSREAPSEVRDVVGCGEWRLAAAGGLRAGGAVFPILQTGSFL